MRKTNETLGRTQHEADKRELTRKKERRNERVAMRLRKFLSLPKASKTIERFKRKLIFQQQRKDDFKLEASDLEDITADQEVIGSKQIFDRVWILVIAGLLLICIDAVAAWKALIPYVVIADILSDRVFV